MLTSSLWVSSSSLCHMPHFLFSFGFGLGSHYVDLTVLELAIYILGLELTEFLLI